GDGAFVHVAILGETRVLGVLGDDTVSPRQVLHRPAQQTGVDESVTVVGEDARPGLDQLVEVSQVLALPPEGEGARRHDVAQTDLQPAFADEPGAVAFVDHRHRVGHGHDRGETAGGGCSAAGGDVFFPFLARFPQVDVEVHQAWPHPATRGVDLDQGGGWGRVPNGDDAVAVDHDVGSDDAVGGEHGT